jgi:5'-methylthioadenosine phosphorylase
MTCNRYKEVKIGIIGGSGLYELKNGQLIEEIELETPFGKPSDKIRIIQVNNKSVAFIPRHGKGHRLLPSEVPSKANIYALKSLGVKFILAISAVGSLKKEVKPQHFVIPNQIIDRTKYREETFFGNGLVGHIPFSEPFCQYLNKVTVNTLKSENIVLHEDESYICIEGPTFASKAESLLYKSWGAGIIGMTAIPEAKLAREAEISYSMIAMVTDYDCWYESEKEVSVEVVLNNMKQNTKAVKKFLPQIINAIDTEKETLIHSIAQNSIMTCSELVPVETLEKTSLLYEKYLS